LISRAPQPRQPIRFLQSVFNNCLIKFFNGAENFRHILYLPFKMICCNSFSDAALKGVLPLHKSYSKIPNIHQSMLVPYPCFLIISGAVYSHVPHIVYVRWLFNCFDIPKSASLQYPS
ncbi:hypothetical protein T05_5862, partial [Trichinella murrelli]